MPAPAPAGADGRHLAAHLCRARLQPSLSQNGSLPAVPATSAAGSGAAVREFLSTAACKGKNRSGGGLASRELEQGPWLSSTPGFWTPLSGHTGQPAPPLIFPAPPKPGGSLLSEARWGTGDKSWRATTAVALSPTQPRNCPKLPVLPSQRELDQPEARRASIPSPRFCFKLQFLGAHPHRERSEDPTPARRGSGGVGVGWGGLTSWSLMLFMAPRRHSWHLT